MTLRDRLQRRWLTLTRDVLPTMAAAQHWPIRLDHCFMRVCLDVTLGVRWDSVVRRPAIRHLSDAQLGAAVAQAEEILADPSSLPRLNQESLRLRGAGRRAMQAPTREPVLPGLVRDQS